MAVYKDGALDLPDEAAALFVNGERADGVYINGQKVCGVTAVEHVPVTGVAITPKPSTINFKATIQLTAVISPGNATNKAVVWSSSNANFVSVDQTGLITGVGTGSAKITAETVDGGFAATLTTRCM